MSTQSNSKIFSAKVGSSDKSKGASLPTQLNDEGVENAVKGRDERQQRAPLTAFPTRRPRLHFFSLTRAVVVIDRTTVPDQNIWELCSCFRRQIVTMHSHTRRLTSRLLRARIWRFVAIVAFAGVIALMGAIRIDQALFRRDAEHLISTIRAFQVGATTPVQAQQMLLRWPQVKEVKDDCSRQCWIGILLQDSFQRHNDFFIAHRNLMKIYLLLGGTLAEVRTSIQFVNGAFRAHSIGVYVYVPPPLRKAENVWSGYVLIGAAALCPNLLVGDRPQRTPNPLHPSYWVGPEVGCEGCVIVDVTFAPESNSEDVNRLMQFDLSCLNRWWRPCRTQADIMPDAWKQFLQDQSRR